MSTHILKNTAAGLLVAVALVASCRSNGSNAPVDPARQDGGGAGAGGGGSPDAPGTTAPDGGDSAPLDPCAFVPMGSKPASAACGCDKECASGYCENGACCAGASCVARPLGAPCQDAGQCASGSCADGVCCNLACTGACVTCSLPDRPGECVPVPAGMPDTHGICRKDPPESCGQSGACNGLGGCAQFAPGTLCGVARCEGQNVLQPAGQCDGNGTCIAGAALGCAPYTCNEGICRNTCQSDGDCTAPNVCTDGSCGPRGDGQLCTADVQCASGFCVDGVCCENACTGKCMFCARPNALGRCVPVPNNNPDPRAAMGVTDPGQVCLDQGAASCGDNGRCDGKGGCARYPNGETCRARSCSGNNNQETGEGVCRNGSCQLPNPRTCAPYQGCSGTACRTRCTSNAHCSSGNECIDGSCGKRPIGALCDRNSQCSGPSICAQGRCCASACNTSCMSCNVEGSVGTCSPVRAGAPDPAGMCQNTGCSTGCDGRGGCGRQEPGTACGSPMCVGDNGLRRLACNANGVCEPSVTPCPQGFICAENRCTEPPEPPKEPPGGPCRGNEHCESGFCVGGFCCANACAGECRECTVQTDWRCQAKPNQTMCGNPAQGRICRGGMCACPGNTQPCPAPDGVCTNTNNDEQNCGACGAPCPPGRRCLAGNCIGGRPGDPLPQPQ